MRDIVVKNFKNILLVICAVLAVVFIGLNEENNKKIKKLKADNTLLTQTIDTFRNKNNELIYQQEVAVYENDKKLKELSNEIFDLKRKNSKLIKQINSFVKIDQSLVVDSIFISYTDTVYVNIDGEDYIRVPKSYSLLTDHYSMKGSVDKLGLSIDSLGINNTISYREVEIKRGLFKNPETHIQVINSNPYVQVNNLQSLTVKHRVSAWNRWIKPTLVGIAAGVVTYQITK